MSAQDVLVLAEIHRDDAGRRDVGVAGRRPRRLPRRPAAQVVALVLSADGARYAAALVAADRIVVVDDPLLAAYSPEPFVAALQEIVAAEQPRAVLDRRHVDRLGPGAVAFGAAQRARW